MSKTITENINLAWVYVITREGKNYTQEGEQYLEDQLLKMYGVDEGMFFYGAWYNDPSNLLQAIKGNKDAYVILSYDEGIVFFGPNAWPYICDNLRSVIDNNEDYTSWTLLMEMAGLEIGGEI